MPRVALGMARSLGLGLKPRHMRDAYIAIGPTQGRWLYDAVVAHGATNIVEFGTSFGISALWLGAAARTTGGRVVTTEIESNKVATSRENLRAAGLDDIVTVLEGDARETLADHLGPIDLLFFDAWSDVYEPLLTMLEPRLAPGCLFVIDNANFRGTAKFVRHLQTRAGWSMRSSPDHRTAVAEYVGDSAEA